MPLFLHADSSLAELKAAIRVALQSDPHTRTLPAAEFEILVSRLAAQAQEKGVSADSIATSTPWGEAALASTCAGIPASVCAWAIEHKIDPSLVLWTFALLTALLLLGLLVFLWHKLHPPQE